MGRKWVVGIVGPSGSGKSTLSHRLASLLNNPLDNYGSFPGNCTGTVFPEDPKYFKAKAALSYNDRDPISETPTSISWDDYAFDLQQAVSKMSLKANDSKADSILLVEHFLLLHDKRVKGELDLLIFLDPSLNGVVIAPHRHGKVDTGRPQGSW